MSIEGVPLKVLAPEEQHVGSFSHIALRWSATSPVSYKAIDILLRWSTSNLISFAERT